MPERWSSLGDEAQVFRLAEPGGGHLPPGRVLPLPEWLAPNSADIAETAPGRVAGVSAWDSARTTTGQARAMTTRPDALAFGAVVGALRGAGAALGVAIDVVADPAEQFAPQPGWDGHALIEGLQRPVGASRQTFTALRQALVGSFVPLA